MTEKLFKPYVYRPGPEIPRRDFILGDHYPRKFISATIAPGGSGKTALSICDALAMASGRDILGVKPSKPVTVWMFGGEDPPEETERRILAAMIEHDIQHDEIEGRLLLGFGREVELIIGSQGRDGVLMNTEVVALIIDSVAAFNIDVLIIDPFVSSHRVAENDNGAIDAVIKQWAKIAEIGNVAVELLHHTRKTGGQEITAEDGRGASALHAAARSMRVINPMSAEEARDAGIEDRWPYFRTTNGKASMSPPGPKTTWYRHTGVPIGNGDNVGTIIPWRMPNALDNIRISDVLAVQRAIHSGTWREDKQSRQWVGYAIAQALNLDLNFAADKAKVASLQKTWLKGGALKAVQAKDEKRMLRTFIEVGNWMDDTITVAA